MCTRFGPPRPASRFRHVRALSITGSRRRGFLEGWIDLVEEDGAADRRGVLAAWWSDLWLAMAPRASLVRERLLGLRERRGSVAATTSTASCPPTVAGGSMGFAHCWAAGDGGKSQTVRGRLLRGPDGKERRRFSASAREIRHREYEGGQSLGVPFACSAIRIASRFAIDCPQHRLVRGTAAC